MDRDRAGDRLLFQRALVDSALGTENAQFEAQWPFQDASELRFDSEAVGIDKAEVRCTEATGKTSVQRLRGGSLTLGWSAGRGDSHLFVGSQCNGVGGAYEQLGMPPRLDEAHPVESGSIAGSDLYLAYGGSRRLRGAAGEGATVTIDVTWQVKVRYVSDCAGMSVQTNAVLPVRFERGWGRALFCPVLLHEDCPREPPAPASCGTISGTGPRPSRAKSGSPGSSADSVVRPTPCSRCPAASAVSSCADPGRGRAGRTA